MAADQDENSPPAGEQQASIRSYIEAFRPLVPTEGVESTSERLQHIFVTNGSPASFGQVVSEQWHADRAAGRSTWAVLNTPLEMRLLEADLVDGATDIHGQKIDSELVARPSDEENIPGAGIVIMTFERLIAVLSTCWAPKQAWRWNATLGSPTVVMNFAWGDMSFNMAFACPLLARVIEDTVSTAPRGIMACTVSSENKQYFGREWRLVKTQEITSLTRGPRPEPRFRGSDEWGGIDCRRSSFYGIEECLSEISSQSSRASGQKTLLLAEQTIASLVETPRTMESVYSIGELRPEQNVDNDMSLGNRRTYLGQTKMVSDVVVYPYFDGYTDGEGQIVRGEELSGVPRSQAEINYYSRCNQESDTRTQVHILASEKSFRELPAHCETSAAHNLHLARLLVCCKFVWPKLPLSDVPVLLPANETAVMQQLRYLCDKGIMARPSDAPGEVNRPGKEGKPELYRMVDLTGLGMITAMALFQGVRSLSSAHLLAQLLDKPREHLTGATAEAFLAVSVLMETVDVSGTTLLSTAVSVEINEKHDWSWYESNLKGIAKGNAGRGPIWLAAGMWRELMHDYRLRGPLEQRAARVRGFEPVKFNGDSIEVDVEDTLGWDRRLVAFNNIFTDYTGLPAVEGLKEIPLTAQESLALEVALVRAFMDRIMIVEEHGKNFKAWDMASGLQISRPDADQRSQIWWDHCQARDTLVSGETCPVIFCVYSHLAESYSEETNRVTKQPVDTTVVSARAVRLALEGTKAHLRVRHQLRTTELLKERARQVMLAGS